MIHSVGLARQERRWFVIVKLSIYVLCVSVIRAGWVHDLALTHEWSGVASKSAVSGSSSKVSGLHYSVVVVVGTGNGGLHYCGHTPLLCCVVDWILYVESLSSSAEAAFG